VTGSDKFPCFLLKLKKHKRALFPYQKTHPAQLKKHHITHRWVNRRAHPASRQLRICVSLFSPSRYAAIAIAMSRATLVRRFMHSVAR
jgi:hypothetical protein